MSDVYILGSGFSASCGLPTLRTLFQELLSHGAGFKRETDEVLRALEFLYPHIKTSRQCDGYPPFEEFLSLCYASIDFEDKGGGSGAFTKGYWKGKYKDSLRLLTYYFREKSRPVKESKEANSLTKFVEHLQDDDVVITFNWDTLVEQALRNASREFDLTTRIPDKISLFKLHGSLSWIKLPEENDFQEKPYPAKHVFPLAEEEKLFCATDHHDLTETWTALDEPPFIVTPIMSKKPVESQFMGRVWHEAFSSLMQTQVSGGKIIVIGYSLPSDDLHARALLRSSFLEGSDFAGEKKNILIDPNPEVAARYFTQVSPNFRYLQKKFTGDEFRNLEIEDEIQMKNKERLKKR